VRENRWRIAGGNADSGETFWWSANVPPGRRFWTIRRCFEL